MLGDAREPIEVDLLETAEAVTIAAAYPLPKDFRLVTRELLMWDQCNNQYPALVQQILEAQPAFIELGYTTEVRLPGRWIVYFEAEGADPPATTANAYRAALEHALMQDLTRGGYADFTELDTTPTPLLKREGMAMSVFEVTICFVITYEYNPRLTPVLV